MPITFDAGCSDSAAIVFVRYVGAQHAGWPAIGGNSLSRCFGPVLLDIDQQQLCAFQGKALRNRTSIAYGVARQLSCAHDDGRFAGQSSIRWVVLWVCPSRW